MLLFNEKHAIDICFEMDNLGNVMFLASLMALNQLKILFDYNLCADKWFPLVPVHLSTLSKQVAGT